MTCRAAASSSYSFSPSLRSLLAVSSFVLIGASTGCQLRHWAPVEAKELPPAPGAKVLHSSRVIIAIAPSTASTQCISYERYRNLCFRGIRESLRQGIQSGLWPAFPEVVLGDFDDAGPSDYVLQVDLSLDALPPDDAGPGWSAGARGRYRVMREGQLLLEESFASRSRAEFAYGAPLKTGATEVVDAAIVRITDSVSRLEETRPLEGPALPQVATRRLDIAKR